MGPASTLYTLGDSTFLSSIVSFVNEKPWQEPQIMRYYFLNFLHTQFEDQPLELIQEIEHISSSDAGGTLVRIGSNQFLLKFQL